MRRILALTVFALLLPATAAPAQDNFWLMNRVLNMSHQGGEIEHPSSTMYAMRESLGLGADSLELDVQPTKDGVLMIQHDQSVRRTTGVDRSIYDMTVKEVQALDAAYNFVPGRGTVQDAPEQQYPLRGVRTGKRPPPLGYRPRDFRIPTLEELMLAFPDVPLNIEIKGRSDADTASFLRNAELLAETLKRVKRPPMIVTSFKQEAVDHFRRLMPDVDLAPGVAGITQFSLTGKAPPGTKALQAPPEYNGVQILNHEFVRRAKSNGYAVHAWFSGSEESERVYRRMLDYGVDGLMPAKPRELERVLCELRVPRPAGNPNHCGGGAAAAAERCLPRVAAVGRVDRTGRVRVRITRGRKRAGFACAGTVLLKRGARRARSARTPQLGSTRFLMPYGAPETTVRLTLGPRSRARLRRARGGRLLASAFARVDAVGGVARAAESARPVTLRRARQSARR